MSRGCLGESFANAFRGIALALARERNLRIHLGLALAVVVVGLVLHLAPWEWAMLFLAMGLVISLELLNTALEAAVDLGTREMHPLARLAKDASAGAVLVGALASIAVGLFILGPHLFARLR